MGKHTTDPALILPPVERILRQIILKDLANHGRPNWDKPHTEAVVYWMKELLPQVGLNNFNPQVMIAAAYAHDWGYASLFSQEQTLSLSQIMAKKQLHMKLGAEKIERLLYQRLSRYFSTAEILRVHDLVAVHDQLDRLQAEDELLLMECDTLGMLDSTRVQPTFSPADNERFMKNSIHGKRLPLFIHQPAIDAAAALIQARAGFFN